jgi:hypothetical protein
MKATIVEVEHPMFLSFTMFEKLNYEQLREKKEILVVVSHHTKTRLSTTMYAGQYSTKINLPIEGVKTFEESEHSYFTGNYTTSNYFVKSKKQDFEAYKKYLITLIGVVFKDYLHLELDELKINLVNKAF